MNNFTYYNPVKILFGKGQISGLCNEILPNSKILMVYGQGSIKKNGVYEQVVSTLKNYDITEFMGIEANPCYETCMEAVGLARRENIDFILAVGGGSVVDAVKFISAAIPFNGEPWDICEKQSEVKKTIPFGTVLTLPATGSEMNQAAVISKKATHEKLVFMTPLVYPTFSILDPEVTFSLPDRQVANGIVDAFTHVMEQYLTYPQNALIQDGFAESILKILIEVGPKTLEDKSNYKYRETLMWAATNALNGQLGLGVIPDWATHRIGHVLTALYGLDHAQTLAVILPAVMQHQLDNKKEKLCQYLSRVWGIDGSAELAIEKTRGFFESLGVKTYLADYDIDDSQFDLIADTLEKQNALNLGERAEIDKEGVKAILQLALSQK